MVTIPTIDQISGSTVMRKMRDLINHFITFAGEVDEELTTIENSFDNYYTKVEVDGNFYTKTYINTNYYDKTSVDYLLTRKADVFALGNGLIWYENQLFAKIDGTTITFDSSGRLKANVDTSNFYTKTETDNLLDDKQDVLTAGTGISITNDVISATGGEGSWRIIQSIDEFKQLFNNSIYDPLSKDICIRFRDNVINSTTNADSKILFLPKGSYPKDIVDSLIVRPSDNVIIFYSYYMDINNSVNPWRIVGYGAKLTKDSTTDALTFVGTSKTTLDFKKSYSGSSDYLTGYLVYVKD